MPRVLEALDAWRRRLAAWRGPARPPDAPRAPGAPRPDEANDWAHASAVGEEDPGASVDVLDTRVPPPGAQGDPTP